MEYERGRTQAAKKLGVRVDFLDAQVSNLQAGKQQGTPELVLFPTVAPWPESVDGAALVVEIVDILRRFIVLNAHQACAIALWIIFTWTISAAHIAPILNVTSPEKRCGKSTLLDLINRLVFRPLAVSNISPAALFRCVEKYTPTLLIDEADSFVTADKEELRGIINSGHTRASANIIRSTGEKHEPTKFSTWCAKLLAGIGKVPDTVRDRSIVIELRRKTAGEKVERLRYAPGEQFKNLSAKLARWSADSLPTLSNARPAAVDEVNDRAQDNWEPLLAIADTAGDEWPMRARQACRVLSGIERDSPTIGVELLCDCIEIFEQRNTSRLPSVEILDALCVDDEKPWATLRHGKPMTAHLLAKHLGEFGIKRTTFKIEGKAHKGYVLDDFADAKARYLPAVEPQQAINGNPVTHL